MSVIDDINDELEDHENRIGILEDSVNTPDEDVGDFETDTNQAISDLQQNSGQLSFPVTQDTIDLINSVVKSGSGLNGSQLFTSSGTFTVPSGFTNFYIRALGGGANGGSLSGGGAATGGKSGVYCESVVDLTGISSVTVTIGSAGGDTSFGTYVVAPGGGSATSPVGTIQLPSQNGQPGQSFGTSEISGAGANSPFGTGGYPVFVTSGNKSNGNSASGYGAGGSGSASTIGSSSTGGSGSGGLILITW